MVENWALCVSDFHREYGLVIPRDFRGCEATSGRVMPWSFFLHRLAGLSAESRMSHALRSSGSNNGRENVRRLDGQAAHDYFDTIGDPS